MRAQFIRGQDPKDAMEIGDVKGRKLKSIENILKQDFAKLFKEKIPEFGVIHREVNVGIENRKNWSTDKIIIYTQYGGYYFNLSWEGNPLNVTEVSQRFEAKWQKGEHGPEDGESFLTLNQALQQLGEWIKQI